jgi:hypothetical protein
VPKIAALKSLQQHFQKNLATAKGIPADKQ